MSWISTERNDDGRYDVQVDDEYFHTSYPTEAEAFAFGVEVNKRNENGTR